MTTILACTDEDALRQLVAICLERTTTYDVVQLEQKPSGIEFYELENICARYEPAVLVADIELEHRLGKLFRSNEKMRRVGLISLVSRSVIYDMGPVEHFADFYLGKPFNLQTFGLCVTQLVDKRGVIEAFKSKQITENELAILFHYTLMTLPDFATAEMNLTFDNFSHFDQLARTFGDACSWLIDHALDIGLGAQDIEDTADLLCLVILCETAKRNLTDQDKELAVLQTIEGGLKFLELKSTSLREHLRELQPLVNSHQLSQYSAFSATTILQTWQEIFDQICAGDN